jgi:hypothetical protein
MQHLTCFLKLNQLPISPSGVLLVLLLGKVFSQQIWSKRNCFTVRRFPAYLILKARQFGISINQVTYVHFLLLRCGELVWSLSL